MNKLWIIVCLAALGGQDPLYVKQGTWQETMLATHERFNEWEASLDVKPGPWFATAPMKAKSFSEVHFPVSGVSYPELDARFPESDLYPDSPQWKKRAGWVDGKVHGLPLMDRASTYLFRTIQSDRNVTLTASLGSDDGIEVWLNNEKILSKNVPRGVAPDQDQVPLTLVKGENKLLLKIHNGAGGHGFYFSLRKDPLIQIWRELEIDFPHEARWMVTEFPSGGHLSWFRDEGAKVSREWLDAFVKRNRLNDGLASLEAMDLTALRLAVEDLVRTFPDQYDGDDPMRTLDALEKKIPALEQALRNGDETALARIPRIEAFKRQALLANPLLDFDEIVVVKRTQDSPRLGLPQNWQGNCSLPREGFDDELSVLSKGALTSLFHPEKPAMIADVDLHFDADRMLFSMIGDHDRWQIFEVGADGTKLRQVTPGEHADVDNYDACYLPDGRIIFDSTRCFQGIPCVTGSDAVANLFIMDDEGTNMRQLCFDQDHDWCPTVLNNGRVLYARWEYSDTPHYFTRILFHMNPDGTGQMEYYGSNSFWPNSIFYARPVPGHASMVAAIVSGHHGVPRMGELVLFDPALGRFEADGVVQRIPGRGKKVEPVIVDRLVDNSWPKFLHPFPLSEKYFLVSCKPGPRDSWGVYLVDVFDNMLPLHVEPGHALFEPTPLRSRPKPPVIPDKVRPEQTDAVVYLADVYHGQGLQGVPRGTVERLRIYEFHYGYNKMGGHIHVGIEGPWDVHRILGTVPVYNDGSASFTVPANTPLAVQPLDGEGKAVQLMRSWFTAMPGEVLSCVGCHEPQNTVPPVRRTAAARRAPSEIKPWYGPTRGFSFVREVQPVLDRNCVGCHDGTEGRPDLRAKEEKGWSNFSHAYIALHPYVRRPGPESDYHLQKPLEFHADTSELMQMLDKGHHGVKLESADWDRLITWIDLNVPGHGTWGEHKEIPFDYHQRRLEMRSRHACVTDDPETIPETMPDSESEPVAFVMPAPPEPVPAGDEAFPGWPVMDAAEKQASSGFASTRTVGLGGGMEMEFAFVPAGEFLMGDCGGSADEAPRTRVAVPEPFYMGRLEVTCAQYRCFDPQHFNGYHDQRHKDHTTPGYEADAPQKPVIRVTWLDAMAFCEWLSEKTGLSCTLPTEAQWEWACRAGTDTDFSYGGLDTDFSSFANLADLSVKKLAVTGVNPQPIRNPNKYQDYLPKDGRFDDGERLMSEAGSYAPNVWGLFDMHGNVSEWTLSDYCPYPYCDEDGRNSLSPAKRKVVRGGSWRDRPKRARSSYRLAYRTYQPVFNVGFRVVMKTAEAASEHP